MRPSLVHPYPEVCQSSLYLVGGGGKLNWWVLGRYAPVLPDLKMCQSSHVHNVGFFAIVKTSIKLTKSKLVHGCNPQLSILSSAVGTPFPL